MPDQLRPELRHELGAADAVSIVVGTVIGSGIYLVPAVLAREIASPKAIGLIWIAGGLLSLFGALSLAELGAMYPRAGGLYVYLREAFGPLPAFLYGWGLLVMIHTGALAALAAGFGVYASRFLHLGVWGHNAVSATCILLLTGVNCLGIRLGKLLQNALTTMKLGGIGLMTLLLFAHGAHTGLLQAAWHAPIAIPATSAVGAAMVGVLWALEGWHVVTFTTGELKRPRIDLPRGLGIGTSIVLAVYLLTNLAYYSVLTPAEVRSSPGVAAAAMAKSFGHGAGNAVAILVLLSVLGALNGIVATGPRVYYAMARDGLFFQSFGALSRKYRTPTVALLTQGIWGTLLSWSGSYQQLFTDVIFAAWLFYGLTVAGLLVLRKRKPLLERPYRVPAFPWSPLLFCAAAFWIAVNTIARSPTRSALGVVLILTGIPLYIFFRKRSRLPEKRGEPSAFEQNAL